MADYSRAVEAHGATQGGMNFTQLKADLIRDEGLRLKPYKDTVGKTTIGCGRNLNDLGISEAEAEFMLENDIVRVMGELDKAFPWWTGLSEQRQVALCNMAFNLGISRLQGFRNMLAALQAGDYEKAAHEAFQSHWSGQVGARADRICKMILEG